MEVREIVFVPFPGDFFSMGREAIMENKTSCFRPLSRGLFFNYRSRYPFSNQSGQFSSPFPGTFFQLAELKKQLDVIMAMFSSPFPGTFFQLLLGNIFPNLILVFVPFPGDFFSIGLRAGRLVWVFLVFVPFPGDFFSIFSSGKRWKTTTSFSSPFPGTFFQ